MRRPYAKKYSDLTREMDEVSCAIYKMREQVTLSVPLADGGVATAEVYRLTPPAFETTRQLVGRMASVEMAYSHELAFPAVGWRANWLNWWHRKRLRALVKETDKLLQTVTSEQSFFIRYKGMPAMLVTQAKVKLAMVAMVAVGIYR